MNICPEGFQGITASGYKTYLPFFYFPSWVFIVVVLCLPPVYSKCISSVQSLSRVRLFMTPWIAACQASLSITNSRSSLRLTSIESVLPSSHLILCHPLLLWPPILASIRVFSNESTLCIESPYLVLVLQIKECEWSHPHTICESNFHVN